MAAPARLIDTKRELDAAMTALADCGSAERSNLECRIAGLQDRFLARRASSLDDVAVRLGAIRALVASLGEAGLLLNLVDAALADVEALQMSERRPPDACSAADPDTNA